jgi:two-component system, sporulation sensor kinase E
MKNSFLDKLLHRIDRVGAEDLQNYLQRLAREKGFLETIFNTLQEGVLVLDPQGKILYLNPRVEQLLGLRAEQAVGQPVKPYLKELAWDELLQEPRVVSRDLEIFYPEHRYLNFYLVPLEGGLGFAMIFHDLTAYREQTRETIESEKINALTLLAAGVAHELGNPLNSLNIHFQLLERELRKIEGMKGDRLQDNLRVVRAEISRLDTIINQFLRAVRPTAPNRHPMQVQDVMEQSLEFLQPEITDRDVLVETEYAEDVPAVDIDQDQIKQAFYNIIKNALQAMGTGGILRITIQRNDTHVVVSFTDNGSGIAPEHVTQIFEPYFTTKATGSGLGLLIVQRIVRDHGGELEMQSEADRGTTVRMLLPLKERRIHMLPSTQEEACK